MPLHPDVLVVFMINRNICSAFHLKSPTSDTRLVGVLFPEQRPDACNRNMYKDTHTDINTPTDRGTVCLPDQHCEKAI